MRLAIFGGTFDPIHRGHVQAAIAAADACALDRVLVVPSGSPPHKSGAAKAPYEHRFRMVELSCVADPRLEASRLEEPQDGIEPHYTIRTVDRVSSTTSFEHPLRLIIGADAFADVGTWYAAEEVVAKVEFLVVARPGWEAVPTGLTTAPKARIIECSHPASSSLIRHRVKIGGSLADLAPSAVSAYIWEHCLYQI